METRSSLSSFFYLEQGRWPTPRWAVRVLSIYTIAALSGGLLFVIYAACDLRRVIRSLFSPAGAYFSDNPA
jgi:hypothetical protein